MEKEFVPYEQALELKGLGFDKPCLIKDTEQGEDFAIYYEHENGRPTFSQAFKWFREKFLSEDILYLNFVPQMKNIPTGIIIWSDSDDFSTGSVGSIEYQKSKFIRVVEFNDFFIL